VRFRVESEVWHDHTPQRPELVAATAVNGDGAPEKPAPYTLIGSIAQAGLGPILWWDEADDEAGEDEEGDAGADAGAGAEEEV
jgi:DNA-directed RNA polymerase III subunit RPC8